MISYERRMRNLVAFLVMLLVLLMMVSFSSMTMVKQAKNTRIQIHNQIERSKQ